MGRFDPWDTLYALTAIESEEWVQREDGRLRRVWDGNWDPR